MAKINNENIKIQLESLKSEIEGYAKYLIKNLSKDNSFWEGHDRGTAKALFEISILINQLLEGKKMDSFFNLDISDGVNAMIDEIIQKG